MSRDQDLMNALMTKLYKSLAAGDAAGGSLEVSPGYYLSIASPGLPLTPEDLSFSSSSNFTVEEIEAASAFAEFTNNIPPVSGLWKFTGSLLWNEYSRVLEQAVLPLTTLTPEERTRLSDAQAILWATVIGLEGPFLSQTPLYRLYEENKAKYEAAQLDYNARLADVEAHPDDPIRVSAWIRDEPLFKARIVSAKNAWISGGRSIVEAAQATIEQLTGRDPFLIWGEYRQRFDSAIRADSSGVNYYVTTPIPKDFYLQSNGWSKFTFDEEDISALSSSSSLLFGGSVSSNYQLWSIHESNNIESDTNSRVIFGSSQAKDIEISLEFRRVALRRSWLEPSIFSNRGWRLSSNELLSNGNIPPSGRLALYPIEMIVVRNITLKMNFEVRIDSEALSKIAESSTASWGPFRLRGSSLLSEIKPEISRALEETRTIPSTFNPRPDLLPIIPARRPVEPPILNPGGPPDFENPLNRPTRHNFTRTQNTIVIPGMQVIGMGCALLPLCPNPNLALNFPP